MDAVTSLGGMPVKLDEWKIDACYSGAQKCIGAPPGFSPISYGAKAVERLDGRKQPVQSFYLDLGLIRKYWGTERVYHHTAPISLVYALREALRLIIEEGLEARWARHQRHQKALVAGLEAMGLKLLVENPERRLWSLTTVRIPDGVNDVAVRKQLLERNSIEIGGGLGPLKGQVWRIGLMGYSSKANNVLLVLAALENALRTEGFQPRPGAIEAAQKEL
jgi:alanine-glyoxylate transaminase/serine-glyoxylate transaminase/serine-pyruvate transaminase